MPVGLAHALRLLNKDAHDVREEPDLGRGTLDETWIPYVAERNWTVITQDRNIARRKDQLQLLRSHRVGAFIIAGKNLDGWSIVEIVIKRMREMELEADQRTR